MSEKIEVHGRQVGKGARMQELARLAARKRKLQEKKKRGELGEEERNELLRIVQELNYGIGTRPV